MVKDHSDKEKGNSLPPHGLLFPISSRVLLYASSHRQDNTYHDLCYTSRGALAGTRNSSMGSPWRIDPTLSLEYNKNTADSDDKKTTKQTPVCLLTSLISLLSLQHQIATDINAINI